MHEGDVPVGQVGEVCLDNVHTQRHRWSILQLEPGYWLLAEVALGRYVRPMRDDRHRFEVEYIESSVDDACVREILTNGYQAFRLRYGTLTDILREQGRIQLNQQLMRHYDYYIPEWEFDRRDVQVALNGISYAPMSRTSRLSVDQLLADIHTRLDQISHTMLLWRDTLVTSDIADIEETRALYHYLLEHYGSAASTHALAGGAGGLGRFLTGPMRWRDTSGNAASSTGSTASSEAPPVVYVGTPNAPHHLIVYQYPSQLLLVMLVPVARAPQLTSAEFYRTLGDHIMAPIEAVHYRMAQERRGVERVYHWWVLARRDARREVYFVVDRKDATLVQVEEEFRRLSAVDLGQIVMDR
ncbi:hypothetical protein SYNPS1DRAFT_23506 [Syncephalis pseudoplumigaleata]|uniref:Uncharacterized protein n=1 Tax=Syncephalis pseudoplumigaleata TaxID=1712513 RepID=A0A4P9YYH6_9FUNG|nr:hypothetical protein SYNPS1DRAFT_23506 [Syncephalis pseudoplumigaleata]|eukprot:RKP24401.1 hypothetical protein SYNPS1DRAFT_23506 [Syncephalis pseudoplumigaleata]